MQKAKAPNDEVFLKKFNDYLNSFFFIYSNDKKKLMIFGKDCRFLIMIDKIKPLHRLLIINQCEMCYGNTQYSSDQTYLMEIPLYYLLSFQA